MSHKEKGFSLMEMMVAVGVLLVVVAGVFQLLDQSQQRYVSTSNVEEATAMNREGLDQMVQEIRLAGYPAQNSYPAALGLDFTNSEFVAGGILTGPNPYDVPMAHPYGIRFEADTDEDGLVTVFDYQLHVPPVAPAGCAGLTVDNALTAPTLMRSAVDKLAGGGAAPPVFEPFLGNVMNCTLNIPIFTYCPVPPPPPAEPAAPAGCPTLAQTFSTLPAPQNTRVVMINLQVQTSVRDPQTGVFQNIELFGLAHRINPDQ